MELCTGAKVGRTGHLYSKVIQKQQQQQQQQQQQHNLVNLRQLVMCIRKRQHLFSMQLGPEMALRTLPMKHQLAGLKGKLQLVRKQP